MQTDTGKSQCYKVNLCWQATGLEGARDQLRIQGSQRAAFYLKCAAFTKIIRWQGLPWAADVSVSALPIEPLVVDHPSFYHIKIPYDHV